MRTVVLVPNWLGDAIMALPVLSALRAQGEVVGFGAAPIVSLLEALGQLDRAVVHDREHRHAGARGILRAMAEVRRLRADRIVSLVPSERASALVWGSGAVERWSSARPGVARWASTRWTDSRPDPSEHLVDHWLRLIDRPSASLPSLRVREEWVAESRELLERQGTSRPQAPGLVIAPGATFGPTKRWPMDRFTATVELLRGEFDQVTVVGGAMTAEREDCEELARRVGGLSLAGRTSLGQLAGLLADSTAFLGNDSGPMHLAAALGTPTIGVFTSTSPGWTAPRGPRAAAVGAPDLHCAPCFASQCVENFECMEQVQPEQVATTLKSLVHADSLDRRPVLWVDRDGTLLDDPGYLRDPAGVRLLPGASRAVAQMNRAGWRVVLVTNQSGIGRGLMERSDVDAVHAEFRRQLEADGARLDHIELCPHAPDAACDCRKPAPGMIDRARESLGVHPLAPQVVLGDKAADVQLARAVGARSILVRTGDGTRSEGELASLGIVADEVVDDAASAAKLLRSTGRGVRA